MKCCLVIIISFLSCVCKAQEKNYHISAPLDLRTAGWNKVLCMKNGNTMLFHLEPGKRMNVKVFDASRKLVASRKDGYKLLDVFRNEYAVFKGLYEINGEAVLFIEQELSSKHCLMMFRFDAVSGMLTEERLIGESKSENRRIKFYVMKNKEDDNYQVLFCMDKRHPKESDIFIVYFNSRHESVKEIQLDVDRKKYDYLEVIGAESQPNGVFITIALDKALLYSRASDLFVTQFGKSDHDSALKEGGSVYEHYAAFFYIPKDSAVVRKNLVNLSEKVYPYSALYTYNKFAGAINLLLYSYKPVYYKFGLNEFMGAESSELFFKIDERDLSAELNLVRDTRANEYLKRQTDTSCVYDGLPVQMFTNENGLSTVVSQNFRRYGESGTMVLYDYQDYLGNICITQFDDDGNEIWGAVLPLSQYYNSNRAYLNEKDLSTGWQNRAIFGDLPAQVYSRQFLSFNTYSFNGNFYIIYNDYNKNFNNSLKKKGDTVYGFGNTNTCYYKLNRKREVTKHYLFGQPGHNEFNSSFMEGADFDERSGVFATLVQSRKYKNKPTLRMAWVHLD